MISGFAYNGQFREALLVYNDMCREEVTLDDTVFVAALGACAHGGLILEFFFYFIENQICAQFSVFLHIILLPRGFYNLQQFYLEADGLKSGTLLFAMGSSAAIYMY
ncbi:hypothetical protein ACJX0J_029659, partial [Zea mays]